MILAQCIMLAIVLSLLGTGTELALEQTMSGRAPLEWRGDNETQAQENVQEERHLERIPFTDQAEILESLGICCPGKEQLDQMEQSMLVWYEDVYGGVEGDSPDGLLQWNYRTLLSSIGYGDYNYDTGVWVPNSSQVYAFDTEVFNIEDMYGDFLKGVEAINNGEFAITNVWEDTSGVDWESGMGVHSISFQYNGHSYQFDGEAYYDWMDCNIIDFMNEVLEQEGNPKRLLCMDDGGQGYILFYNTPDWGKKFWEKTHCLLSQSCRLRRE